MIKYVEDVSGKSKRSSRSVSSSPGWAVGECDFRADVGHVDYCASGRVLGGILDELVGDLGLVGDVLAADLISAQTEWATLSGASGALTPANWADAVSAMLARRIAESSTLNLVIVADERDSSTTAVGALSARDANISHASWAVWGADAAANIMEAIVALGVPEVAPFLAGWSALVNLSSTSAIGIRLVAVCTIVTET